MLFRSHKVIACAWQPLDAANWHGGEPDRDFIFAGALAFEDPVREGVQEAIHQCRNARIRVIMITGDHPATALAIAREIGLGGTTPRVVKADDLQVQLDRGEVDALRDIAVIARAIPAQKLPDSWRQNSPRSWDCWSKTTHLANACHLIDYRSVGSS